MGVHESMANTCIGLVCIYSNCGGGVRNRREIRWYCIYYWEGDRDCWCVEGLNRL